MKWLERYWPKKEEPQEQEVRVVDMMEDDVDPEELTIANAYKTRWIWYHTILAIEIFTTNILLIAILIVLAVKL
tara:strand:+ start:3698 stop:3919 length:222 start_codon:yes stop_codon:yes gene_type:complete